jgi:type IV secretory pathway TraG/TraD family ATPase VirD4
MTPNGTPALSDHEVLAAVAGGVALGATGICWAGAQLAALVGGGPQPPANPFAFDLALATGRFAWCSAATVFAAGLGLLAIALLVGLFILLRRRKTHDHVDRRATHLTKAREIARYTDRPPAHLHPAPGLPIGRVLPEGRKLLRATWEDQIFHIAGTRTGKTTSTAIPAVLAAPGAVVVTSNKRDIVDATRGPREGPDRGPIWLFDPQRLAGGEPTWWWDPLSAVTDVRTARKLATIWATVGRDFDARVDPYFHPAGQELLAMMLLAAARGRRPVSDVYEWLTNANDDTPRELLARGDAMWERGLEMQQQLPEKQRAGVYGTAQSFVSFLADPEVLAWVTDPQGFRSGFDPKAFTQSGGTLYSISKEGEGSCAPLTTALTAAVLDAAEQRAAGCSGGRLPVPLVAVLDEAANICRWRELPNLVSHYGSRGIVLAIILQSWSQGIQAWGLHGLRAMFGAVNLRIYGGGVADTDFLRMVSELCGDYDRPMRSRSSSARTGVSTSLATHREHVFDIATLGALPPGRAVVMMSGARPVLVRSEPWMKGPHADAIRASIARFDPMATVAP